MREELREQFALFRSRHRAWDYGLTFGTEFLGLLSTLVVFRLAGQLWGQSGFGEYVLMRRAMSMLQLPLLMGMGLAVTRYVAMALSKDRAPQSEMHLVAALLLVTVSGSVAVLGLHIASDPLAFLLFGDAAYRNLVRVMALPLLGLLLHGVAYGYFRGKLDMRRANLLQTLNLALIPLLVFLVPALSVARAFLFMGVGWCLISASVLITSLAAFSPSQWSRGGLWTSLRELTGYGAPRLIGDGSLGALLALPAIFAAHLEGVEVAGHVGLGVSLVSMIGSFFAPVGHIMLPSLSAHAGAGTLDAVRRDVGRIVGVALLGTTVVVVTLELLLSPLLAWYLGEDFRAAIPAVRVILAAAIPYVAYVVLRNVLDAVRVGPYNAKNLTLGVIVLAASVWIAGSASAVPLTFLLAVLVVGLLSGYDAASSLRRATSYVNPNTDFAP